MNLINNEHYQRDPIDILCDTLKLLKSQKNLKSSH